MRRLPYLFDVLLFRLIPLYRLVPVLFALQMQGQTPCLTDWMAARNALRFPELAGQKAAGEIPGQGSPALPRSVATIPVVVHVVYKGNLENIPDEQILGQMVVLHEDFRRLNNNAGTTPPLFAPLAADVELEFCLASRTPDGLPTNGITRRQTNWDNIGQLFAPDGRPRIFYTELGGESAWDPAHYLNIWVCGIGGGILGYGIYPGSAPPAEDGVVIDPRFFGTTGLASLYAPHHLGRTATHEIGHYFNLLHIWGGDNDTCDDDDDVFDTPVQRSAYLGCPSFPQYSCGNPAMFMNFMDYTDDACMSLFTLGQKNRIWSALTSMRATLLDSALCGVSGVHDATPAEKTVILSPNPAVNTLEIHIATPSGIPVQIRMVDVQGKIIASFEKTAHPGLPIPVDLSAYPNGWYAVRLIGPGFQSCLRLLILR